jgi:putative colanic acid biosynthesis glycosyltransferase
VPKLSIIIPVFNGGKTLGACLQSIVSQTFEDFEIIVCDGDSLDETAKIIEKYGEQIIVSTQKDRGVYDAMNRGLDIATGEWIYFLGADDRLADSKVLSSVFSRSYDAISLILGKAKHENLKSSKVPVEYRSSLSSKIIWRNSVHHQSAFYHNLLFTDFRYDLDYEVLADYHLNLKLYKQGVATRELDDLIAVCDADGLSKQFNVDLYKEEIRLKSSVLSPNSMVIQRCWIWIKYLWKNS